MGLLSCTNTSNMEDVLMFIQLNPNFPSCTTSCLLSIRATRTDQFVGHVHKCRHPDRSEVPTAVIDWKTSMTQRVCRSTWAAGAAHFANATHVAGWTSVSWAQDHTKASACSDATRWKARATVLGKRRKVTEPQPYDGLAHA